MGIFAFPRIHVKGLMKINVGTANNDDYSSVQFPLGSPYAGDPVRLSDSINVKPLTYGKSDEEWIAWVQTPQTFQKVSSKAAFAAVMGSSPESAVAALSTKAEIPEVLRENVTYVPAEWNYYGDMGFEMLGVRVIGVQYPGRVVTSLDGDPLIGAELSFKNRPGATGRSTGMIVDINAEDVPCSQIFSDFLTLEKNGRAIFSAKPTKAVTRWINFQRNTGLSGSNGAACLFQSVVPVEALQGQPILEVLSQGHPKAAVRGLVFRYYLYRPLQKINAFKYNPEEWTKEIVALYAKKELNPDYAEVVGTIAPWLEGEPQSAPVGRLLNPTPNTIPVPGSKGNGSNFQLAPALLNVDRSLGLVSVDFSGTFPDAYSNPSYDPLQLTGNPKFDFGPVHLVVSLGGKSHDFGAVPYVDTDAGNSRGWVFDFSLAGLSPDVLQLVENGSFSLRQGTNDLLGEVDYLIVSDQSCIFAEQGPTASEFMNQGPDEEKATIRVYQRGVELPPAACPDITVWEYDTTPNQAPGLRVKLATGFKPGQPLTVDVSKPGNRLYTFTLEGQHVPPEEYGKLSLMTVPMINLRILPNNTDYSRYYKDPSAVPPVGNDSLTFEVIYEEVLRNYYLLYPGMSQRIPLNDPENWSDADMAGRLMQRTQKSWFGNSEYMPRTRDLSASRRTLLQAWCLKFLTPDA